MNISGKYLNLEIRVLQGPGKGSRFYFEKNIVRIGRDMGNDVILQGDNSVSQVHAEIQRSNGEFVLTDRSATGTLVNNHRVESVRLKNRDQIRVGAHLLEILTVSPERARKGAAEKKSLFQRPAVLIGGGAYLLLLAGFALLLSSESGGRGKALDAEAALRAIEMYMVELEKNEALDKERRIAYVESFLKSAYLAEKQGRLSEARRLYAQIAAQHSSEKTAIYRFAIRKLEELRP